MRSALGHVPRRGAVTGREWSTLQAQRLERICPNPASKLAVGIGAGIAIGVGLGMALGNVGLGLGVGLALGVAIGTSLDQQAKPKP